MYDVRLLKLPRVWSDRRDHRFIYRSSTIADATETLLRHYWLGGVIPLRIHWIFEADSSTLLQAPYTDPVTGLRYHDKSVYELIKGLVGARFMPT